MKANEKIQSSAVALRSPPDDADVPILALSTLVQGLSSPQARGFLDEAQQTGDLDAFLAVLGRWLIGHRSDGTTLLVVVELPLDVQDTPDAAQLLELVAAARVQAEEGPPDLTSL